MAMSMTLPAIGTRINHSNYRGTVRFVGPVDGTRGNWLGIEWDDVSRGKHDGVKDGKRYFTCLVPNSGSFIRPTASGLSYGTSFLNALSEKYIESFHGTAKAETIILGSSNGAIAVEAVNLDKIRAKLARLDTLREASLDEKDVATADLRGKIKETCPDIRGLDLSKTLLPSWDMVALITSEFEYLERLALNCNRLTMPTNLNLMSSAYNQLQELQVNATLITWSQLQFIISFMPQLVSVEVGFNNLSKLTVSKDESDQREVPGTGITGNPTSTAKTNTSLRTINLDGNKLRTWSEFCQGFLFYSRLERLILSCNEIDSIDSIDDPSRSPIRTVRHLALSFNSIRTWKDVDRLPLWCPALESLKIVGNPLIEDWELGKNARQFIISKIPSLTVLDAAHITPRERTDSEIFYLSYITKHNLPTDEHPRWKALCEKYGSPDLPGSASSQRKKDDTLKSRLFHVNIYTICYPSSSSPPTKFDEKDNDHHHSPLPPPINLSVLPTMTTRSFRLKLIKSLKISKKEQSMFSISLKMPDGNLQEICGIGDSSDSFDLDWWGLEDGSDIVICIQEP
ncbi:hypothetical protein ABKN59_007766 [Abortiporus biennis]